MLGIGQIASRIAELIRGALPYAIVNNNPDASMFARLISYRKVQQALDAGHKWIQIKESDVNYEKFTINDSKTTVIGNQGVLVDGGTDDAAVTIADGAEYCRVEGIRVQTTAGGGNDYHGVDVYGDYNTIAYCTCVASDQDGFTAAGSPSGQWNLFIGCVCIDCDRHGFAAWGQGSIIIGCRDLSAGTYSYYLGSSGTNIAVGNLALNGGTLQVASSANMVIGNMFDVGIAATSGNAQYGSAGGTADGANQIF